MYFYTISAIVSGVDRLPTLEGTSTFTPLTFPSLSFSSCISIPYSLVAKQLPPTSFPFPRVAKRSASLLRDPGERSSSPSGCGRRPAAKTAPNALRCILVRNFPATLQEKCMQIKATSYHHSIVGENNELLASLPAQTFFVGDVPPVRIDDPAASYSVD